MAVVLTTAIWVAEAEGSRVQGLFGYRVGSKLAWLAYEAESKRKIK